MTPAESARRTTARTPSTAVSKAPPPTASLSMPVTTPESWSPGTVGLSFTSTVICAIVEPPVLKSTADSPHSPTNFMYGRGCAGSVLKLATVTFPAPSAAPRSGVRSSPGRKSVKSWVPTAGMGRGRPGL
jgi:hypothetical protein